ncbi:MAG: prolyl oligopeptidase family serine peptidase, partial [Eubacteriales bacterium]|nr:prolyl oligopeptidase family serine peptidase [Eubacteriales bacterium]
MRKADIVENYHGTYVADPYRWLEDSLSPESQAWIGEQNKKTRAFLDIPRRQEIKERLTQLWDFPQYELPKEAGGRLFFQKNEGLQNQAVLYCQDPGREPFVVLDPNTFSPDGTVALTRFGLSPDGKLLAYALSASGSDWQKIRIRNVDTGEEYPETINWCRFTNLPWTPDGKGFFYSRFPETGTVPPEDESNYCSVYYHAAGTAQREDILIYQRPDAKELGFTPIISEDDAYLGLVVTYGTSSRNRFYYRPLAGDGEFVRLLDQGDAAYWPVGNLGKKFYFLTDLDAPRGRIVAIDIDRPGREDWEEIIPQTDDVIDQAHLFGGQLVLTYMHHACHRLERFSPAGAHISGIDLPGLGTVTGTGGRFDCKRIFIGYTSYLFPPAVFSCDLSTGKLTPFGHRALSFDPGEYETSQVFYASKDGARVPMFITHKKGLALDGANPTVLFGYGGFNISMTPNFWPMHLMFMERGGVFAVANLRGGSEYGEDWHRAGMLENKQNVFDDFIAAGEWLINNKYTSRKRLAILGRSNGGLLVSASM